MAQKVQEQGMCRKRIRFILIRKLQLLVAKVEIPQEENSQK